MVHDEEAGISMKLETLLRQPLNRAKLVSAEIKQKWKAKQNMPLEGLLLFSPLCPKILSQAFKVHIQIPR